MPQFRMMSYACIFQLSSLPSTITAFTIIPKVITSDLKEKSNCHVLVVILFIPQLGEQDAP